MSLSAAACLDSRVAEGSQGNQALGGGAGEEEEHRRAGLESLQKQSWIRRLDTPDPGENLIPNRQAASFPPPPILFLASLGPAYPP